MKRTSESENILIHSEFSMKSSYLGASWEIQIWIHRKYGFIENSEFIKILSDLFSLLLHTKNLISLSLFELSSLFEVQTDLKKN